MKFLAEKRVIVDIYRTYHEQNWKKPVDGFFNQKPDVHLIQELPFAFFENICIKNESQFLEFPTIHIGNEILPGQYVYLILKATDDPCVDYADEVVSLTYYSYSLGVFGIVKGIKPLTIESAEKQYKKPIILRQPVPTNLDMIKTPEYVDAIPHNAVCVRATGWADSTEFTHRIESFIYPDKEVSDQQHYVIPMESFYAKIKKLDTDKKQDFKEYFDKRWEVAQKWHIS